METKIYSNKDIIDNISDNNVELKKWAKYLDSKGAIIIKTGKEFLGGSYLDFVSTKHNIVSLNFQPNKSFCNVEINDEFKVCIYLNEESIDDVIDERYDGINLGTYFRKEHIDISYENYCKINEKIKEFVSQYPHNVSSIGENGNNIYVKLTELKSNIFLENIKYTYLIFDSTFDNYEQVDELPEEKQKFSVVDKIDSQIFGYTGFFDKIIDKGEE